MNTDICNWKTKVNRHTKSSHGSFYTPESHFTPFHSAIVGSLTTFIVGILNSTYSYIVTFIDRFTRRPSA